MGSLCLVFSNFIILYQMVAGKFFFITFRFVIAIKIYG
ncbi:Uncharacterized protein BM_BM14257 [Brugia malayi]|uniref:Bm14257 n=1 Tax=Brugia malayi TaxID=6279 RepID=A0A0K0J0P0_BRUMA|nr:Uncharacterized protein BM_BM14257 [Brugia malayi]CDP99242.1 Bm14257 [Brugia malayi]VIO91153.1 Uncharacterized protein BM_BM14257 [Brugia malayi]